MSTSKSQRALSGKSLVTIVVTVTVSVLALIYFLPRESKFGYKYELDKPWRYSQLIASFDFPIRKTEQEIKNERDSVMKRFVPYYTLDSSVVDRQVQLLQKDFHEGKLTGVPISYLPRLVELFREVYRKGVVSPHDMSDLQEHGMTEVRLVRGKQSVLTDVSGLYNSRSAYDYIMQRDRRSLQADVLQQFPLNNYIVPNIIPDTSKNRSVLNDELSRLLPNCGMVQMGQLIINRGDIVTAERLKILDSLKDESERRMDPSRGYRLIFAGQVFCVLLLIGMLLMYLKLFRRDYFNSPHSILLLFSLVAIFPIMTYAMMAYKFFTVYIVPYAIVPMFIRIFMDSRTSFMALVVTSLLSALALQSPFEFILLQITTGIVAIYSLRELTERSQLLKVAVSIVVTGLVVSTAYDLSQGLNWNAFDSSRAIYIAIGGLALLFAYPLMYLVERLFGFTSSVTLVELNNINTPILRRMSKVAQGTFNHSMQVANLAAEVADKIGAKPQLVRTGALYHDIGKMTNPTFFTENQTGVNPHDKLTETESAQIIISHITEGLRLADKSHLPKVIRDFISTHHGKGLVKYFYIQYCNNHPNEEVDKSLFTYPGTNPQTKEQAILMMCDAVEAASRSLKEYTEESISTLVNRIIDGQQAEGYFRECPLTFRDVEDAKRTLIDTLKTVYHTRISYPELNKNNAAPEPVQRGLFGQSRHRGWKL